MARSLGVRGIVVPAGKRLVRRLHVMLTACPIASSPPNALIAQPGGWRCTARCSGTARCSRAVRSLSLAALTAAAPQVPAAPALVALASAAQPPPAATAEARAERTEARQGALPLVERPPAAAPQLELPAAQAAPGAAAAQVPHRARPASPMALRGFAEGATRTTTTMRMA